tara:strand:- start:256 stop:600 length:345 start_codon:yes stop_codon:yes gene_type:complete
MIDVLFEFGPEAILIKVDGNHILFGNTVWGAQLASIEGLRLDKAGTLKEFPDLADVDDWGTVAMDRFKEKIASFETEEEKVKYIAEDLKKHGYIPKKIHKQGRRPVDYEKWQNY